MPILVLLELSLQVYFAVHALRSGRDKYWLYIILMPGIGIIIYFFSEYLPELQANARVQQIKPSLDPKMKPEKRLKLLKTQVEISPSLNNKKDLAREYVNACMFDQAIETYESCLQGAHKKDTGVLEGLSCAFYFKGDYDNAIQSLGKLINARGGIRGDQFDLLLAEAFERIGKSNDALDQYDKICNKCSGEEARCKYALLLKKTGKTVEANKIFEQILKFSQLQPKYYLKDQKEWIDIAKRNITDKNDGL